MTKQEFLATLKKKISVLNRDEINDILDEYAGYIDNKISEGQSEEEAVADFGDLDDLAREILSAYKINDDFIGSSSRKSDPLAQQIADGISYFLDQTVQFLTHCFKGMDAEGAARIVVLLAIALVVLFFMRLPFWIIEGMGSAILSLILPNFLEGLFHWAWSLVCNIGYLIFAVVLIMDIIKKKGIIIHKTIHFNNHKVNVDIDKDIKTENVEISVEKKDGQRKQFTFQDGHILHNDFDKEEEEYEYEYEDFEDDTAEEFEEELTGGHQSPQRRHGFFSSFILALIKIMVALFLSPFFFAMIGLWIAVGILVFLAVNGGHVWGILFILAGIAGLIGAFCGVIWSFTKSQKRLGKHLISAVISAVMLGFGTLAFMSEFSNYTVVPWFSSSSQILTNVNQYVYTLDQDTRIELFDHIDLRTNTTLQDNEIRILITTLDGSKVVLRQSSQEIYVHEFDYNTPISAVQAIIKLNIEGLRNNIIYSYENDDWASFVIEANAATMEKLNRQSNSIIQFTY